MGEDKVFLGAFDRGRLSGDAQDHGGLEKDLTATVRGVCDGMGSP